MISRFIRVPHFVGLQDTVLVGINFDEQRCCEGKLLVEIDAEAAILIHLGEECLVFCCDLGQYDQAVAVAVENLKYHPHACDEFVPVDDAVAIPI